MKQKTLDQIIQKYYKQANIPDSRFRSWDYCYNFFQKNYNNLDNPKIKEEAARQLGLYLASWGMYRGSGFLLKYAYTVHKPVICALASERFSKIWEHDIGKCDKDIQFKPIIIELVKLVDEKYRPFGKRFHKKPTDTLITKILLGTVGCLPACDKLFKAGFRKQHLSYSTPNENFVDCILDFCNKERQELINLQFDIKDLYGNPYPIMKLVDMYFWQIGADLKS